MNKSLVAAGVVGVVVIGLGAIALFGLKQDVSFELRKDAGSGLCLPTDPEKLVAAWPFKVTWTVTNVDCDPQYVSLRNFKHPLGGGTYDPPAKMLKPDQVDGGPIAQGTPGTLSANVDKPAFGKLFKYEIWVGPSAATVVMRRDPDMEIWP